MTRPASEARGLGFCLPRTVFVRVPQLRPACLNACRPSFSFYAFAWSFSMSEMICPNCGAKMLESCLRASYFACTKCLHVSIMIDLTARNDARERSVLERLPKRKKQLDCVAHDYLFKSDKGVSK
jgi:hypothetical protein